MKVFSSWSGGKESCLAYYKAIKDGFDVSYLLNFLDERGERSRSHGLRAEPLHAQSDALGIPIVQRQTTWKDYGTEFKKAAVKLKKEGVMGGVFGDIDLQVHRDWVERVCGDIGIKPIFPLWYMKREKILEELINAGFKAIVVATKADLLGEDWLGCRVDNKFIKNISKHKNIDSCGEAGEYHTFVIDGPIFKKRLNILESAKILKNGRWILDITKCELVERESGNSTLRSQLL